MVIVSLLYFKLIKCGNNLMVFNHIINLLILFYFQNSSDKYPN